jgi:hypothetical protein
VILASRIAAGDEPPSAAPGASGSTATSTSERTIRELSCG